ncbi:extracellular solute-binding protein [Clostridium tarantellae]|uniref:Extracellular solute-binding protein n=1 Tax=Clostridium tarantellae TaxID=39493 RepID=A0A6I1MQI3_9CLOT|nr:extracellular solute-binding protein [Clostridium tarantellae]MPQ44417.1 extracellular solute-binding protein [Clostridium tarantellae]
MKGKILKNLSLIMTVFSTTTLLTACGNKAKLDTKVENNNINVKKDGYPVVDEEITIKTVAYTAPTNGDFNEMSMIKELEELTGVNLEFECIASNVWKEKKNLILASGKLPDLFLGGGLSDSDISKYGKQGMLIPLENLIDEYAPNLKKILDENPKIKKAITSPDGHIYTIPFIDNFKPETIPDNLFINKTWLDKLGLEIPKTTDEYYKVLKAFKEKDPNGNGKTDEIPLTYRANETFTGEFSMFGAFGVLDNKEHLMVKNDKIIFSPMEDNYKEAIKWFNKLYTEGLIDKEVFTHDGSQYTAKGKNEEMITGSFIIYADENFVGAERAANDYVVLEPLKGPNGDQLWNRYDNNLQIDKVAITNANKNPEATMRVIDEFFKEDFSLRVHWGELDKNLKKEGDSYAILPPKDGMSVDEFRFKNCPGPNAPGIMSEETYSKLKFASDKERKIERYEIYDKYANPNPLPIIRFTDEQSTEIGIIFTDIDNYVKEMKAKWITGQRSIDEDWESYKEQLKKMGIDKYINIYQDGYNQYK